jgi:hypothetical protein
MDNHPLKTEKELNKSIVLAEEHEETLTDISVFLSCAVLFLGFLIIAFISAEIGLVIMLILYTLLMIYFANNN